MSQTQEDSQGLYESLHAYSIIRPNTYRLPLALTFWQPSTPSQRERTRKLSLSSCPPTPQHLPALHSPPPTKRPRRGAEPVPGSISAGSHPTISRYKRAGGRDGKPPALNAEFEIDPAANGGVPFAFDEVVRAQRHRHRLDAGECEECRGWYAAVGPLPPRLEAPRWSSPPSHPPSSPTLVASESAASLCYENSEEKAGELARGKDAYAAGVSAHRQEVSRHRAQWERAPTPPGYWDIGFPDTQAVEKINERAEELHRQKRACVAKEAAKEVGGGIAGGLENHILL
ncbi:hypothetical protein BJV77DRAFT_1084747 [Russula vinacea]|nr:hypothetical protein BJV77DRAFT_1084747 [Russula vinacea]